MAHYEKKGDTDPLQNFLSCEVVAKKRLSRVARVRCSLSVPLNENVYCPLS